MNSISWITCKILWDESLHIPSASVGVKLWALVNQSSKGTHDKEVSSTSNSVENWLQLATNGKEVFHTKISMLGVLYVYYASDSAGHSS